MTAPAVLAQLSALGISLEATPEGTLRASPISKLTPELIETLKMQKQALIRLLEPSLSKNDDTCPKHWLHIPVLTLNTSDRAGRYRACLFGKWYILRFTPNISATTIEVTCAIPKRRMFADLNEFYRWAWAEHYHAELTFKEAS
jgi:hypothetical protein